MKITICLMTVLLLAVPAIAADKYVDLNATGANNGTSWADAWTSLATPMTSAAAGDTIHIAAGTYVPASTLTPTVNNLSLIAKTGDEVILSGDTNGDDTFADLLDDPCALEIACVSGNHMDNVGYLIDLDTNDVAMTLKDMTITGSKDSAIFVGDAGSSITCDNCLFTQNYSDGTGGCISAVSDNSANGEITVTNCRFIQNSSNNRGSVIYSRQDGKVTISNCLFQINNAIGDAAAVNLRENPQNSVITDSIFDRCTMCNNTGGSGAIFERNEDDGHVTTISNCVFKECNTYQHGAAYYFQAYGNGITTTTNISNCLVTGSYTFNQLSATNSAIHVEDKTMTSCTVNCNLTNCTIAGNTVGGQGAIGVFATSNSATLSINMSLKNCIVWGNTGTGGNAQLLIDTGSPGYPRCSLTADYSCWDNSDPNDWGNAQSIGTGNLLKTADASLDPGFEPGLLSEYALSASSPCIDTGDPTSDYSAEPKCNGDRINMGVYGGTAYATPTASSSKLADLDCDNDVDLGDFSILSGQWLQ